MPSVEPVEWPEWDGPRADSLSEPEKPEKPHRLKLQDAADLDEEEPEVAIIPEWLPAEALVEVYGAPKAGKSWFVLDLCLHIATGLQWCGLEVKQTPVIYLIGEGKAEIRKRVRAWYKAKGIKRERGQIKFLYRAVPLTLENQKDLVVANLEDFQRPRVIVIDTVNRFMDGDENSTEDMSDFVKACDKLRGPFCGITVHHTGRKDEKRPRGSNVLDGALDVKIATVRDKKSGLTEVSVDESRSGANPKPVYFRIRDGVLCISEKIKLSEDAIRILEHLLNCPATKQADIATRLDLDKTVVSRSVKELEKEGLLGEKVSRRELGAITPKGIEFLRMTLGEFFQEPVELQAADL